MKIVINRCFGGFGLSLEAKKRICELRGGSAFYFHCPNDEYIPLTEDEAQTIDAQNTLLKWVHVFDTPTPIEGHDINEYDIERNDQALVQAVEELGPKANGRFAELSVVEIPDDIIWELVEYDGIESVHEQHRSWD